MNLDYATVFSLAPFINENVITIIGICLVIGAMAKSSQVGQMKANKKWWCSRFFSSFQIAGKVSNALESVGPVCVHKCYRHLNRKNNLAKHSVRHYSTKLIIRGQNLESRVGISLSKREGNMIKLPENIQSIIIGLMLSRGRLQKSNGLSSLRSNPGGIAAGGNARFIIGHSMEYSIYIWYLFSLLSPYCSTYPYIYNRKNQLNRVMELRTRSLACFTELYIQFYNESKDNLPTTGGKKIIPLVTIFDLLTREALAHWFLASQMFRLRDNRNVMLNYFITFFCLVEAVRLMNVLLIKFDIISTLESKGSSIFILISEKSHSKFKCLIDPYISNFVLSLLGLNTPPQTSFEERKTSSPERGTCSLALGNKFPPRRGTSLEIPAVKQLNTDPEKSQRQGINQQVLDQLTVYNKLVTNLHDKNFLFWFIGFTEGDGSFVVSGGKSIFSIHLHVADLPLLYIIQNELNMGQVQIKKNSAIFQVKANRDIFTLISIFNGNLFLLKRQKQFNNWLLNYNIKTKIDIIIKPYLFKPSLNDSWLAGFIDAEGCFTISIRKDRERIEQKFVLVQKDAELEMIELTDLIGGRHYQENNNISRLYISYSNVDYLVEYLGRHKLYSIKSISFEKWVEVYNYRKNKPSDLRHDYPQLKKKVSLINSIRKAHLLR